MLHPDSGIPVGALCLCFNFEEEMAGIFRSLADEDGRTLLLLLDGGGRVIASGNPHWVREGSRVPLNLDGEARLLLHGGREYLVHTQPAAGYQGYKGPPGWHGQVMTPVDVAFRRRPSAVREHIPPAVAEGLLTHAHSFCPPLFDIVTAAGTVRRVVWNGQVAKAGCAGDVHKLRTVLGQVGETGARSNELFGQSIGELYETVLASHLRDAKSVTRLLVDLLDRNLYERSDDCRWWALTPELRHALAEPEQDFETRENLGAILDYINGLYTVYTRLFVYDSDGRILVSSSRDGAASVAGERIDGDTLAAVMACCASSGYREFKVSDGYRDDVLAVVFRTFGAVCPRPRGATRKADDLDSVPRFHPSHIVPSPVVGGADGLLVKQVVHANGGDLLVQVSDVPQLFACIEDPSLPTVLSVDVLPANVKSDAIKVA